MVKSVYVLRTGSPGDWKPVVKMFQDEGWEVVDTDVSCANLVCFCGGSDVSPSYYNEVNTSSYIDSDRDAVEYWIYQKTIEKEIPMVGICRGGQFLNVMNGGKMIQHIEGHSMGYHKVMDWRKEKFHPDLVHGDHHQSIDVESLPDGALLMSSSEPGLPSAPEVVWYEDTRSLCFQPHPEWGHEPTKKLFFNLIEEYIFEEGH